MLTALLQKLAPDTTVLTANSRLARTLQSAFDVEQEKSTPSGVWPTLRVLPLSQWLASQFYACNNSGYQLLTPFQEQCVWQEIIQQTPIASTLLQPTELAKLVQQAFSHMTLWQVPFDALTPYHEQSEARYLSECFLAFQTQCQKKNWITACELPNFLKKQHREKPLTLPNKIILIGFDDHSPALQTVLSELSQHTVIETDSLFVEHSKKMQVVLADTETEIKTMAAWAKAHWEKNPKASIGCVVPDLGKIRHQVHRIFSDTIPADQINLSAGAPLSQHHMIHVALTVLRWCHTPLPIETLSSLLQSPYICFNEDEKNMGAQLDALLRQQNKRKIHITDLYAVIAELQPRYPKTNMLSRWRNLLQHYDEKKSAQLLPSAWCTQFIAILKAFEWPSQRTQTSFEYQLLERFKKVCTTFSTLDWVFAPLNYARALHFFNKLMQDSIFQPQSHHEPIQIMGTLEASGIIFDAVWIMGLHDGVWPANTKPHPLIPYAIQQHHQMPHATPKRELQFCDNVTKRLENAAKEVIFSSPAKLGEQLLFPSRLLSDIPMIAADTLSTSQSKTLSETIFEQRALENRTDEIAPPITDFSRIRGGSAILKLQALCPFRAFATVRLNGTALNTPEIGIPAMHKGTLVHQILFILWGQINDQSTLLTLSDEACATLIENAIDTAFSDKKMQAHINDNRYFYAIEKKRLRVLIQEWIDFEKTRPYFRVIARELACDVTIGQLPMQLRQDRIDVLSDGSTFLIDYKTGFNSTNTWFQERLTDPQLPLYAVFQSQAHTTPTAIAFAEIKPANMALKGVMHEKHLYASQEVSELTAVNTIKNGEYVLSWDETIVHWEKSLRQLSDDFCQGIASVDPIKTDVCNTCDLKPVCRIAKGL